MPSYAVPHTSARLCVTGQSSNSLAAVVVLQILSHGIYMLAQSCMMLLIIGVESCSCLLSQSGEWVIQVMITLWCNLILHFLQFRCQFEMVFWAEISYVLEYCLEYLQVSFINMVLWYHVFR